MLGIDGSSVGLSFFLRVLLAIEQSMEGFVLCWVVGVVDNLFKGMVQAWVAHFVRPLKCRHDESD